LKKSVKFVDLEVNGEDREERICQDLDKNYEQRVLLVRDFSGCNSHTYPILSSFASRYGVILANVPHLMKSASCDP